jgi:thioredoxin reductase (NADPH)
MFEIQPLSSLDGKPEGSDEEDPQIYDLIIMGAGPAGLTAAIYTGRARISTLVLTGTLPGGQPVNTDLVENFPGFPEGIAGPDLAQLFQSQAARFGARLKMDTVTEVDFTTNPFTVNTLSQSYQGRTVIVATGAVPRMLGVPGEEKFYGRGVSACATCDGFFYRDKKVVVVGGGDSAITEAMFLTRFAKEVVVIHRREELRATKIYQEKVLEYPQISFAWNSVVEEVLGEDTVTGVRVRNVKSGESSIIETDGVFIYIGMVPQTEMFAGQLEMDDAGYIISDERQRTNVPGVFVAGDVQDPNYRQLVIAAATGTKAAMEAGHYITEHL